MKPLLQHGAIYRVRIRGPRTGPGQFKTGRTSRRIFKWCENRFGEILCYVFSAQCRADVRAEWNPTERSLRITGQRVPASEVSVPHYDLEFCEAESSNRKENNA